MNHPGLSNGCPFCVTVCAVLSRWLGWNFVTGCECGTFDVMCWSYVTVLYLLYLIMLTCFLYSLAAGLEKLGRNRDKEVYSRLGLLVSLLTCLKIWCQVPFVFRVL